jgi:urea transport system permease protein
LLKEADGAPLMRAMADLEAISPDFLLRGAIKVATDRVRLMSPNWKERMEAANVMGSEQKTIRIPVLLARLETEEDSDVKRALRANIARTQLKVVPLKPDGTPEEEEEDEEMEDLSVEARAEAKMEPGEDVKVAACQTLGELTYIPATDVLKQVATYPKTTASVKTAAQAALSKIGSHVSFVNAGGTLFRGLSSSSILLIAALGLAITFGLMGVINMAHGEMIALGAYTTYVVQCLFGSGYAGSPFGMNLTIPGLNLQDKPAYEWYFVVALPLSFLVAALAGLLLERSVIRFLYRRPLESLLATWGVSLVLQQLLKLTFGANPVSVVSPVWLSGSWTWNDIDFTWKRVFIIGFAIAIVIGTQLLLKKTPLGLLIRAVMQNRQMAGCMGVRTDRVNMLTFAFGSGLAGLAGAFVSQLGSVGSLLGTEYIVDNFMTVVVGGVGNLIGTVIGALGIGMADQTLQQYLGDPRLGKVFVLVAIILFLQWKPSGLFVTRSRSLES